MRPSPRASRTLALGLLALALVGASAGPVAAAPDPHARADRIGLPAGHAPAVRERGVGAQHRRPGPHPRPADHVLAQRRRHDEERAQEEPDPRRQPPEPGRGGLQRRPRAGPDLLRAARPGARPLGRRRVRPRPVLHRRPRRHVRARRRPDGRDEHRPRHAPRGGDDRGVPGGRGRRRQQRRRRRPVAGHDQRLLRRQRAGRVAAAGRGPGLLRQRPDRLPGRPAVRLPERHHRPARVRVRPDRPLPQRLGLDRQARPRHGRRDRRGGHGLRAPARRDGRHPRLRRRSRRVRRDGLVRRPQPHAPDGRRRDAPAAARLRLLVRHDDAEPGRHADRQAEPRRPRLPGVRDRRPAPVRCSSPAGSSAIRRASSATRSPRPPAAARRGSSSSPRATP